MAPDFFRASGETIELVVRLTPRGGMDALDGIGRDDAGRAFLKARVRAVPEKGAANAALERLLAKRLGVAPSRIDIVAGATARLKTVRIAGAGADLLDALRALG
ncbi:DUF167 family protein [Nitratireductor sp. StC3]|uniref:DUF167 family protein n=1 Tax=Nitratireductor sp. StC3 TaxID=2126741 RepID=UPI000D0D1FE7|nr:DUF167 family protein [Nitratireductor sp. StC3]PSM19177.1 hypothetical protein C7T96_05570 [Nitratireductor sp. StC3]